MTNTLRLRPLVLLPLALFVSASISGQARHPMTLQGYLASRLRRVETQLVRYPREGHGFREARHPVDALERTIALRGWFLK